MSGVDTADSATAAAATDASTAHDRLPFVTPRTYLEQGRPAMPPRALTAADREQLDGLASSLFVRRAGSSEEG